MTTIGPTSGRSDDTPERAEYSWDGPAVPEAAGLPVDSAPEDVVIHQPGTHPAPSADEHSGSSPWGFDPQVPAPGGLDPYDTAGGRYDPYAPYPGSPGPDDRAPADHDPYAPAPWSIPQGQGAWQGQDPAQGQDQDQGQGQGQGDGAWQPVPLQQEHAPSPYAPVPYAPVAAHPQAVQPYTGPVAGPVVPYQQQIPPYQQTVVVVQQPKSVGIALLLTFFFGPLGMLYSTLTGFIVMFLVNLVVVPLTVGLGALLTWPACMIWGAIAASNHNSRIAAATWTGPVGPPPQQPYQQPYQR